ncbi:MAG: hypothetical protein OEX00_05655 [Gammaproteobacteria bacterium]|nr:hypothetical protein [Gammaproteobacteria bacterium]
MVKIPKMINDVVIEFAPDVYANNVHERLVAALEFCIRPDVASGQFLKKIYISSAKQFGVQNRHSMGKAVDIQRINGVFLVHGYNSSGAITALADAIQARFEEFEHRRENYGPGLRRRLGREVEMEGYHDHIHLSIT